MKPEHRNKVILILIISVVLASGFNLYFDKYSVHTGGAIIAIKDDGGGGGGGSSGGSTPVCGNNILESGEQCDTNRLNSATCITRGYVGGTLSCSASCTYVETACHNCGDGTCDNATETCSSCLADCSGEQADCSEGQICEFGECVAQAPTVCNDTTPVNTCSNVTGVPWYCNANGTLIEDCGTCGCPDGSTCDATNTTCTVTSTTNGLSTVGGSTGYTYTIDDATVTTTTGQGFNLFGGGTGGETYAIDNAASDTHYSWDDIGRGDTIEFEIDTVETQQELNLDGGSRKKDSNKHTFKVDRISRAGGYVKATFRSDPIDVVLYEGEPQRVDLDGDGVEDIVVLATDIGLSTFNVDIQEIDPTKLEEENVIEDLVTKIKERKVFFPDPLLSPVLEGSPEANISEFVIVNILMVVAMGFFFFNLVRSVKKR